MPYKEKETTRLFFTIGEVAKKFNVNQSLIRFWEKEFEIIRPQKNKKGNRMFTQVDVDNFHLIYHLVKERGYTLAGAKEKIKSNRKGTEENVDIVKSLARIREFLLKLKEEL